MKRFSQFAIITLAVSAMAAAQAPAPPAPPAPAAPRAPRVPATPATPAVPAVPAVPATSSKHYSYLGVTVRDISPDRVSALKLKDNHGVEIMLVDSDSPAGKAGLREHDVVLTFNGRTLQSPEEFRKLIRDTPPEQTVELGISRDGQRLAVKAQLADRQKVVYAIPNEKTKVIRIPRVEFFATLSSRSGVLVENLTPQLGEVFGVKDGAGVLVRSVEKGSAGDTAGLRAGDVIVRVGSERVSNTGDWLRLLKTQKTGPVQLGIMRDKRQQNLSFNVPERSRDQMIVIPDGKAFAHNMQDFGDDMEDFTIDMHDLQSLQPEIDRAMRDQQEKVRRELERAQREIERAMREQERARDRAQRDADRARERAQAQAERERERAQEQAEKEREKSLQQAERDRENAERERERAKEQAERAREQAERDAERQQQQQNQNPPKPPQP